MSREREILLLFAVSRDIHRENNKRFLLPIQIFDFTFDTEGTGGVHAACRKNFRQKIYL